jgi:broad specificity phosphatase PhoE
LTGIVTRLLLVRHGRSTWNETGRWQGWADPPLSAAGEQQAEEAAARLGATVIHHVVASDLQRARRTAELIARSLDVERIVIEPGFRERNAGEWTGLTRAEIEATSPGILDAYFAGRLPAPPGGEDTATLVQRALAAAERISTGRESANVLVVTHTGLIRALARHLGLPAKGVANLGGRWFEWSGTLAAGDAVDLLDRAPSAAG